MEIRFAKWGNSIAIPVPSKFVETLGVLPGAVTEIELQGKQLIVTPNKHRYRLSDLLDAITPDNLQGEGSTGSPA